MIDHLKRIVICGTGWKISKDRTLAVQLNGMHNADKRCDKKPHKPNLPPSISYNTNTTNKTNAEREERCPL